MVALIIPSDKLKKANPKDDGKPGESLSETSTEELKQTLADIAHRLKTKPDDKALLGRQKAIQEVRGQRLAVLASNFQGVEVVQVGR